MNFTSDIKKELITNSLKGWKKGEAEVVDACKKAALSAFVRTSGELGVLDGIPSFFIVSETENVAEFFISLFVELFKVELSVSNATMDKMSGRDKLVLQCPKKDSQGILQALELIKKTDGTFKEKLPTRLIRFNESALAYIIGAFLGGGSCTVPSEGGKTGYHLEFVFSKRPIAKAFCELLWEHELLAKMIKRKETYVVYIKNKEFISDFLSMVSAKKALKKFSEIVEKRDEANQSNRAANCFSGNADKTAQAAVKQVMAIEKIENSVGLDELGEELKTLALARIQAPYASLQELSDKLGVSKSCLNHRMRRLLEIADGLNA
jgi:DNA-binding protein WhiA